MKLYYKMGQKKPCHIRRAAFPFASTAPWPSPAVTSCAPIMILTASQGDRLVSQGPGATGRSPETLNRKPLGSALHFLTHSLTHSQFQTIIMCSKAPPSPPKMFVLKKKNSVGRRTRAGALSLSVKLQPNYCLLRGAVKHNQSESLKDTISLFTNCLLVNSKSPPCFKSTNHRAVMNSSWFPMQRCKTKSHRILFLMATVFQLHNKS